MFSQQVHNLVQIITHSPYFRKRATYKHMTILCPPKIGGFGPLSLRKWSGYFIAEKLIVQIFNINITLVQLISSTLILTTAVNHCPRFFLRFTFTCYIKLNLILRVKWNSKEVTKDESIASISTQLSRCLAQLWHIRTATESVSSRTVKNTARRWCG